MILRKPEPLILSVKRIWDNADHNAMTDLIRFEDRWLCAFRESDKHVKGADGIIRILASKDGDNWSSIACLREQGIDLRDPKLSITPDNRLMLNVGGTVYNNEGKYILMRPRVSFSHNGEEWGMTKPILFSHEWLWRVTWHQGIAYGASYSFSNPADRTAEWNIKLFKSNDGIDYEMITQWDIPGHPNETTLRFIDEDKMVALVRRDGKFDNKNWIGISSPPYKLWSWLEAKSHLGGPNFILLPNNTMWAAGRLLSLTPYGCFEKTAIALLTLQNIYPLLVLPSGGDCSYPGLAFYEDVLWVSYYSSHEGKSSIYLAQIQLPE